VGIQKLEDKEEEEKDNVDGVGEWGKSRFARL
jgi:hypothetical protein